MISVQGLSCRAGGQTLLEDIGFTLEAGQCVAIVGANGAGKSTLLRILSGEFYQQPGLSIDGVANLAQRPLHDWPLPELAQRRSFLMQAHAEGLPQTVEALIALGAYPHGGLRRDQQTMLDAELAAWELLPLRHRAYGTLSGGERQRAQLARTSLQLRLHEPASERLWLLDEPLNSLDLPHQQLLRRQLKAQAGQGALVLFSVHDLNFALRTADTVLALRGGRLLYPGPARELAQPALLQDIFATAFICLAHPGDGQPLVLPE
jgi:iron complex transport system ATP-binding protein